MLTTKHITFDMINYILIVEHVNTINEPFDKTPLILDIDSDTPYRTLFDIVKDLV
jgi:hypothetical protein